METDDKLRLLIAGLTREIDEAMEQFWRSDLVNLSRVDQQRVVIGALLKMAALFCLTGNDNPKTMENWVRDCVPGAFKAVNDVIHQSDMQSGVFRLN